MQQLVQPGGATAYTTFSCDVLHTLLALCSRCLTAPTPPPLLLFVLLLLLFPQPTPPQTIFLPVCPWRTDPEVTPGWKKAVAGHVSLSV